MAAVSSSYIHRVNPPSARDCIWEFPFELPLESMWKLPLQLPLESRLEIHDTNDPELPFEIRLIPLKELPEQDLKVRGLFVRLLVENHARNQSFEVGVGNLTVFQQSILSARSDRKVVSCSMEVARDHSSHIRITKREGIERIYDSHQGNSGYWEKTLSFISKLFAQCCSCLRSFVSKVIEFCSCSHQNG